MVSDFPQVEYMPGTSYYACGPVGSGKTRLLCALVRERAARGQCLRIVVADLLDDLRKSFDEKPKQDLDEEYDDTRDLLTRVKQMEVLALDDLGSENMTTWSLDVLFRLVNYRYENMLVTHVSSNFPIDDLGSKVDERISRRLSEMCSPVFLSGRAR